MAFVIKLTEIAVGQGLLNQARVFGGSIGLAVVSIIFNDIAVQKLSNTLTATELTDLQRNPVSAYSLNLDKQLAVRNVFGQAFTSQLRVCTYVAAGSFVLALCSYTRDATDVVARKREHDNYIDGLPYTEAPVRGRNVGVDDS